LGWDGYLYAIGFLVALLNSTFLGFRVKKLGKEISLIVYMLLFGLKVGIHIRLSQEVFTSLALGHCGGRP